MRAGSRRPSGPLANLRLSVTDRCNLRCQYCMPEEDYVWLPREDILQFEEIDRLVDQFLDLGVDKVRLTGGEPLLRRDLPALVERLSRKDTIRDLAMTTNAVLLAPAVQRSQARRAASPHHQPRHPAARSLRQARAIRRTAARAGRHRCRGRRVSRLQDRHRRHPRGQ